MGKKELFRCKKPHLEDVRDEFFERNRMFYDIEGASFYNQETEVCLTEEMAKQKVVSFCSNNLNQAIAYRYIKNPELHLKDVRYMESYCDYLSTYNEYSALSHDLVKTLTTSNDLYYKSCHGCKHENLYTRMEIPECFECKTYLGPQSQKNVYLDKKAVLFEKFKEMRKIQDSILKEGSNTIWVVGIYSD